MWKMSTIDSYGTNEAQICHWEWMCDILSVVSLFFNKADENKKGLTQKYCNYLILYNKLQ